MRYGFKYNSNSSFKIVPATNSAGYDVKELREIISEHYKTELEQIKQMDDNEFIKYYGVNN